MRLLAFRADEASWGISAIDKRVQTAAAAELRQ